MPTVKTAEELKRKLTEKGISLWLRKSNSGEIKGFSFKMNDCTNALPIKASDVSANFDKELFRGVQALHATQDIETMNRFKNFSGSMSRIEQREYIRIVFKECLKSQPNLEEFAILMARNGVSFKENKVGNEIKDYSFRMLNREDALKIPLREMPKELVAELFKHSSFNKVKYKTKSIEKEVT